MAATIMVARSEDDLMCNSEETIHTHTQSS